MADTVPVADTIVALGTPVGAGAISIVRLSGTDARAVATRLVRSPSGDPPKLEHGHVRFGRVVDPSTGDAVDECLVIFMESPRSFTGEDVVEFQCHGGTVAAGVIIDLAIAAGARPASPGEFAFRSVLNGKRDLAQAEAIMDIVGAKSPRILDAACRRSAGGLRRVLRVELEEVDRVHAGLEAAVNFPDDVPDVDLDQAREPLRRLCGLLASLRRGFDAAAPVRDGVRVLILGKPNTGKSSFLNRMLADERALVSDIPGTTRDYIEGSLIIGGIPVQLVDTAGIRSAGGDLEREGMRRALAQLPTADAVIAFFDVSRPMDEDDRAVIDQLATGFHGPVFALLNKRDKGVSEPVGAVPDGFKPFTVSVLTGEGLDAFGVAFAQGVAGALASTDPAERMLSNRRQRDLVARMEEAAAAAATATQPADMLFGVDELVSLRRELFGDAGDDLLERVFGAFCIGK